MKLHGNAALSWQGRRCLARRVLEQGWTVTSAAGAAAVSVRCAASGSVAIGSRARPGCRDPFLGAAAGRERI